MPSGVRFLLPERSPSLLAKAKNPYEERWLGIEDAVRFIMKRRDIGPDTAQFKLRKACFSGKVKSRHIAAVIDRRGEKKIRIALLPRDAWNFLSTLDVDASSMHTLDFGKIEQVAINESELGTWLSRPRRGPPAVSSHALRMTTERCSVPSNALCARSLNPSQKPRGISSMKEKLRAEGHR